ncbi:MAG: hypothetical protein LBV72_13835 [Tannerella sp.]|jgi:hypothetical protein|nr:hypothetical protein [Tannerella sp.]
MIREAPSRQQGLIKHFRYLADTGGFEPVLSAIMVQAQSVTLDEDENLVVQFSGEKRLTCRPPEDPEIYTSWPESFCRLVAVHGFISFPDDSGWALNLGDMGGFDYSFLEEGDNERLLSLVDSPEEILNPFTDYSDWWIYHPTEKNPQGEPLLCLFSHESCEVEKKCPYNAGSLLLARMAEVLNSHP